MINPFEQSIIDAAESKIRSYGYNGFTLNELATQLGVELENIHEHFSTKEDLIQTVAVRYSHNFFSALGRPESGCEVNGTLVEHYCNTFQSAFTATGKACLCGVLSNEVGLLPEALKNTISRFVAMNVRWLEAALKSDSPDINDQEAHAKATLIYCSLEGSMSVAALTQDQNWIEKVAQLAMH